MNPVTFNITVGAIPENFEGNLQATLELFASRLIIAPSVPWSSFVVGGAQPSSNVGPWLKDGIELWVWSDALATYIPQVISNEALKYSVSTATPDQNKYLLWVDLNSPQALKYHNGTTWVDVYATKFADYSTTTQMNAAIAAATAALAVGKGAFSARANGGAQTVVFSGPGLKSGVVALPVEAFDPDSAFDPTISRFVAPLNGYYQFNAAMQISTSGGSPTDLNVVGFFRLNGSNVRILNDEAGPDATNGRSLVGSCFMQLTAGDTVELWYDISSNASVTVAIEGYTYLDGYRVR